MVRSLAIVCYAGERDVQGEKHNGPALAYYFCLALLRTLDGVLPIRLFTCVLFPASRHPTEYDPRPSLLNRRLQWLTEGCTRTMAGTANILS